MATGWARAGAGAAGPVPPAVKAQGLCGWREGIATASGGLDDQKICGAQAGKAVKHGEFDALCNA